MTNRGRFPGWVKNYIPPGHKAERRDNTYYLLRLEDDEGNPLQTPERIGVILPDGIQYLKKEVLTFRNGEIWEYGFSKACLDLCTEQWKTNNGGQWPETLRMVVNTRSPHSYLVQGRKVDSTINAKLQAKRFNMHLKASSTNLDELWEKLHTISLIHDAESDKKWLMPTPTTEQLEFCQLKKIQLGEK